MLDIPDMLSHHEVRFSFCFVNAECSQIRIRWPIPLKILKIRILYFQHYRYRTYET